ncbi:MAG: hypothetical protein JOZ58_05850 [Acetobacteraceae bacterium]|nr:hypothetical protein [Acetobacteraceae bacterium]
MTHYIEVQKDRHARLRAGHPRGARGTVIFTELREFFRIPPRAPGLDAANIDQSIGNRLLRASPLRVWSGFALALALTAVPVFSTVLPPLLDYPNHLARMHLLVEGGDAFYSVHWAVLPNLAEDLIVPPLARVMPLDLAAKLFLVMIFSLLAGGVVWLNRIATGCWRLWPLLAFLFLYNRSFLWGFLNYLFGIGIALCGAALWLALEKTRAWLRILSSSIVGLACFFSHIAAFGFYALVILGIEATPAAAELRNRQWPALGRRAAIAAAQFTAPLVLFFSGSRGADGNIIYPAIWRKADLLFGVFDNYDRAFDLVSFGAFFALFAWLACARRLGLVSRLGWAISFVFLAYLLLPSQIYGGSGADHRLPTALFLLLIAATAPRFPNWRVAAAVGFSAAVLMVVRLGVIERVWQQADRVYSADLIGIDALPIGTRLAIAHPADLFHVAPVPEVHFAALAISRREAFVPTLFAIPGQQPVVLNPGFAALASAMQPQGLWEVLVDSREPSRNQLPAELGHYDFIALTDRRPIPKVSHRCLRPFFVQPTFQIYEIVHDRGCIDLDG